MMEGKRYDFDKRHNSSGADLSKKKGEEKRHYEKMRKYYALPLPADEKAKQDIIMQALRGDGDVQGALKRAGMEG